MTTQDAFWKIHEGLPRQGPGSDETTIQLLGIADPHHKLNNAIDMGCGPGRASLVLASEGLQVIGIDTHQPFLEELKSNAKKKSLSEKITIKNMSMDKITFADQSFDLVWSEGTAYLIGWEYALTTWRRLLRPNGKLVVTDTFWLTNTRSSPAIDFWKSDPLMMDIASATAIAKKLGYTIEHTYEQPDSDWFKEYYDPLAQRVEELSNSNDKNMQKVIEETIQEINIRKQYYLEFGHIGFVLSLNSVS